MAWNPTPEVAAARDFGKKFNADKVVIVYTTKGGKMGFASYGETKALCADAKFLGDALFKAAYDHLACDVAARGMLDSMNRPSTYERPRPSPYDCGAGRLKK